ncbi:MAG: Coq4 family protein [Pseudomonadota bacterium]
MAILDRPLVAPERTVSGMKPLKALRHFGKLVEDKEDTAQVFHIIEAMKTKKGHQQGWNFIQSEKGQRFLRDEVDIPGSLDDHARWADLPESSVAQRYIRFMKREGLSAQGLVDESHRWEPADERPNDLTQWYFDRLRDTHDLFHVLTGYGRDALGEAALLGFSYEQNHNPGVIFIAYAGARQIKKVSGTKAPLYRAVREGQRLGKAAAKLAHEDVEALMREDIDAARTRLNIGKPETYFECLRILETEGNLIEEVTLSEAAA